MSSIVQPTTETTGVPEIQAIIRPLQYLVNDILGDNHWRPIDVSLANAIVRCTKNLHTCYVQFPSAECPELSYPLLWNYQAWAASVERNRMARVRSERDRIERWLFDDNCARLTKAICKQFAVTEEQARVLAYRWLKKNESEKIAAFDVTLKTKEEEL